MANGHLECCVAHTHTDTQDLTLLRPCYFYRPDTRRGSLNHQDLLSHGRFGRYRLSRRPSLTDRGRAGRRTTRRDHRYLE